MTRLLAGWDVLDPALTRKLRFNLGALVAATLALTAAYAVGFRHDSVGTDIALMLVSLALMVSSLPFTRRFGARAAMLGLTGSATLFAVAGSWATPHLAPMTAMLTLVPLLVGFPHLPRSWVRALMVLAVGGSVVVAGLSEWRRPLPSGESWQLNALVVGTSLPAVVVVVLYLIYDAYRRHQAQTEALQESSTRVVQVADAARRGLERDLHDGAQQRLLAMSVTIERARLELGRGDLEQVGQLVAALAEDNRTVLAELRELARGIYPPLLTERGLVAAVQAASRRSAVPVSLYADEFARLCPEVEVAAYFCILEAVTNAAKHSGCTEVTVLLRAGPGFEFTVSDNGSGFDLGSVQTSGLLGIEARMAAAGGLLHVESAPGRGTTVIGRFPDVDGKVNDR